MGTGELMPIVQGGHQKLDLNLTISGNTSDYNVATVAAQNGYSAGSDDTPIFVTVNSGVEVTATMTNPALQTGAINAASPLTITVNGTVTGYTGASGGTGQAGSVGGDAIHFNTSTPATGTYAVTVGSQGTVRAGGGGGGGGGSGGRRQLFGDDGKGGGSCTPGGNFSPGPAGSAGAQGGFGQAGSTGQSGSYSGSGSCPIRNPAGSGSAGGAAGFAVRKNSRTVPVTNQGTVQGQTA
jgi:hypothetical protein